MAKWNIETMTDWCSTNAIGYSILDTYYIQKPYQKILKVKIKCPNPNHPPYDKTWNGFKRGDRCFECNVGTRWSKEKVLQFYSDHNLTIKNFDLYKSLDISVECLTPEGYSVFASITNLKAKGTPHIVQYNKKAIENIALWCKLNRPDYALVSKVYTGSCKDDLTWEYLGKNFPSNKERTFDMSLDFFMNAKLEHPELSKIKSKAEKCIQRFLENSHIDYEREKSFKDCKYKKALRFDFYIPSINTLIEAQGEQHYRSIEFFGGDEAFKMGQERDKIKTKYCEDNDISLLRIPYWRFKDIEEILEKELIAREIL